MVCLECKRCLCAGVGVATTNDKPFGHAWLHANKKSHWVALWFDRPDEAYCFLCNSGLHIHEDKLVKSAVNNEARIHAISMRESRDTDELGYVIKGIPNRQNTCYVNATVQCLLALDKLRMWMLGPYAPTGSLGVALKELFVETSAGSDAGVMLNPEKLLESVDALNTRYAGRYMQDSQELLLYLRDGLNEEENLKRPPNMPEGVPTIVDSIFQGQVSTPLTCECCPSNPVSHVPFYELSLPLPSKGHPTKSVASPQRSLATELFPAIEESSSEKVQKVVVGGDPHICGSELESVGMEQAPEPLEDDSTEAELIPQRKNYVHSPLQTQEDKVSCSELSREITGVAQQSVLFLPDLSVKVDDINKTTADSHSPEDTGPPPLVSPVRKKNTSMASGSDVERQDNAGVGDLLNQPEVTTEAKENAYTVQVTKEEKGKALSSNIVYDEKVEDSNSLASINDCLALFFKEEVVEWLCENCSKVAEQPSTTRSKDCGSMVANTDENASVDGDQAELSDMKVCQNEQSVNLNIMPSTKTVHLSQLPPVLALHLMRFEKDNNLQLLKNCGHVSFEENLDVGLFMHPRSADKNTSRYGLVDVIEHIGDSIDCGHYVAYVRGSRLGSHQQSSSGSFSWFRASDEDIREVSLEEVCKCEAFVLFYERIGG